MKRLLLSTLAACALLSTALAGQSQATPTPAAPAQTAQHRVTPKDTTAPGPVTGLTVSGNTPHSISLEWAVPKNAAPAHVLIRRAVGDQPPLSTSNGTLVAVLGSHATEFTDRNLDTRTTYSYAVYAADRQQNLSPASTLTASTLTTNDRTGIRGVLTDKQGRPIAGVWAQVLAVGSGDFAGQATTGADGSYRVTTIQPGTYTVCYRTNPDTKGASPTGYLNGCYRQQPFGYGGTGTPLTVPAGKTVNGINDYLSVAGAISGRITDPSGAGIGNVTVFIAYPHLRYYYSATSAADGSYRITGLPADSYQICFDAGFATGAVDTGYMSECYDDQPPWSGGAAIPVSLGHTTRGINATLAVGGAVTGKVTDPAGNPAPDLTAYLIPSSGQDLGIANAQGVYRIIGIVPGTYTVCVAGADLNSTTAPYGYIEDCRPDVEVLAGQTVTLNHTVRIAGAIGGSVSGPDGSPVAGVSTTLFDPSGARVNGTFTDESGNWQLQGIEAGQYTVCYDPTFTTGGYRRGCYDGQPDGTTTGTPVTVTARQLTIVNDSLEPGAAITGIVTDSRSWGLDRVAVTAVTPDGTRFTSYTDDTGRYTLSGLAAGSYLVCFDAFYARGPEGDSGYLSECYDNQPSMETADPVTVGDIGTVWIAAQLASGQ
jgi:hypothetical protein